MRKHHSSEIIRRLLPFCVLLLGFGCGPKEQPKSVPARPDPAGVFSGLEQRLMNADVVRIDFRVRAEGVLEIDLHGLLDLGPADNVRLAALGDFAGKPVDLLLLTRGAEIEFGDKTNRSTAARPAHLKDALVIGLTRMGILHNLARLTGGSAPDHAEGGVREWVTVDAFAAEADTSDALSFDLTVAGQRSGSASLEIDADGRPAVRRQTVEFPSGEMRVVETYSSVRIEP